MIETEKIISKKIVKEKIVSFKLTKTSGGAFEIYSYTRRLGKFVTLDSDGSKISDFLRSLPEKSVLTVSYQTIEEEEQ